MKKFISALLATVMLFSTIPMIGLAEETAPNESAAETNVSQEEMPGLGTEASIGDTVFYIEDGSLLRSKNNARPQTVDTDVSWVIARDSKIYWLKLEEHNTSTVYFCNASETSGEALQKVFVPVEAFDISGEELYYLYNGEIVKVNMQTGKEETVGMFDCNGFYLNGGEIRYTQSAHASSIGSGVSVYRYWTSAGYVHGNTSRTREFDNVIIDNTNWYWPAGRGGTKSIGCFYGERHLGYGSTWHGGIDIDCGYNSPVYASKRGVVVFNGWSNGYGNQVVIYHGKLSDGRNVYSIYSHLLSSNEVRDDQLVNQGDVIAHSSNTGGNYGYHLDFSVGLGGYNASRGTKESMINNYMCPNPTDMSNFKDNSVSTDWTNAYGTISYIFSIDEKNSISDGGVVKDTSLDNKKDNIVKDTSIKVNITRSPGDNFTAQSFSIGGTISSNYPINWVTAWLKNTTTGETISYYNNGWNAKKINLANSSIDRAMKFSLCTKPGTYELAVGAANTAGVSGVYDKKYFTVIGGDLNQPNISVTSLEEGQRVTITSNDGGYIHYNINGAYGGEGTSITRDLTALGTYDFYAWESKSGYNNSAAVTRSVSVQKAETPVIGDVKYGANSAWVTISGNGNINYTMNGLTPTKSSSTYNGTIYLYNSTTIKAMASRYGNVNSDIASKYLSVTAPDTPTGLNLYNTKQKIAQGKTATVRWNAMERATGYEARLYYNGEQVGRTYETNGTTAAFKLSDVGEYTVKVTAKNFKGKSAESEAVTVESMAPVTVKFVDKILREGKVTDDVVDQIQQNVNNHYEGEAKQIEGNVISVQKIDYDSKPSIPAWADKQGFSREYFGGEAYTNVLEDTVVYAYYSVKSYSVQFWNYWTDDSAHNSQIGATQSVMYSYSAEAPTDFDMPTGYTLSGWNVDSKVSDCYDFTFVDGHMKLYTVYSWENNDLPVILEVLGAKRGNTCQSYDITLRYINNNLSDTQARIIVSLYTADGKMVYTTTEDVDLMARDPGKYYTENIQAAYTDKVSKITAVMVQVKNDMTGGAVSEMVSTTNIEFPNADTYWEKWSDWSAEEPSDQPAYKNDVKGNAREIRTKTEYRARNKMYTTTDNSKTLSGWNYIGTDENMGGWAYNGANWVGTENSEWRRREVNTNWVAPTYKTQYRYGRWTNGRNIHFCPNTGESYYGGWWYTQYSGWQDWQAGATNGIGWGYCSNTSHEKYHNANAKYDHIGYLWSNNRYNWGRYNVNGAIYYWQDTQQAQTGGGYTEYWYRDTYFTHKFWKWNDWSEWSDHASGDETESRTVYSYRDNYSCYAGYDPSRDSSLEEETKETYEMTGYISGLEKDYNGKLATVLVYKKTNTDPTQEQLEYVDQITLGENNSYAFTINPKEEISYENTGDYIVTLSIEGCDKLANIDIIKAPVPQCTIRFLNDNGSNLTDENGLEVIKYVDKNGSVDVNEVPIPQKEGYRFVKWDRSLINIDSDITVMPIYEKKTYNIVFVDYENQTADMVEVEYGNPMVLPDVKPVEGKEFVGWDAECYQYATEGNVDASIFNIKEEIPYYLTTEGTYILSTEYDETKDDIVDKTEYYKYFSEQNTIVTESKIITAQWNPLEYTVKFCDFDGNVISDELGTQTVKYGESAQLPPLVEKDGVLYSWSLNGDEWWNVTKDMIISPYVPQTVQVEAPVISAPTTEACDECLADLSTSNDESKIYYSMNYPISENDARTYIFEHLTDQNADTEYSSDNYDGIDLMNTDTETAVDDNVQIGDNVNDYITEYSEPITVYGGSIVYAFTVDKDGNISPISVFQYDYDQVGDNLGDDSNEYVPDSNLPQITMSTVNAKPGETVTVPVKIKNNMGITNLSVILGYNADALTLDGIENGDVFAEDAFMADIREDGSCKFTWNTESDNSNDGTLLNLTFTVKDTADKSKYLLDLQVEYSGDENDEEWYFITVPGALTDEEKTDGISGDVNGDGDVDFADAILTLKYDAGLKELEDDQLLRGDVNGDGDVDFSDAILIIKFDAGLIDSFGK